MNKVYLGSFMGISLSLLFGACGGGGGGGASGPTSASLSDIDGQAIFALEGQDVAFEFFDESTGFIIPALSVAIGADPEEPGRAVLVIADGHEQYPLQIVILEGLPADTSRQAESTDILSVPIRSGNEDILWGAVPTLLTDFLPPLPISSDSQPADLMQAFFMAVQELTSSNLFLPPGFSSSAQPSFECEQDENGEDRIFTPGEIQGRIVQDFENGVSQEVVTAALLFAGFATAPPLPPFLSQLINGTSTIVYTNMGAVGYRICTLRVFGVQWVQYHPVFAGAPGVNPFPPGPNPTLDVMVVSDSGCQPTSIELVSQTTIGLGIIEVLDTQGSANFPVPIGDYTARVVALGCAPVTADISISQEEEFLDLILQPQRIASVTLFSEPDLTGFLSPGRPVRFWVIATDEQGVEVPCDEPVFQEYNPVGSTVLVALDRREGRFEVGPDNGAARVIARCGGVPSNQILVSGTGEGDGGGDGAGEWTIVADGQTATLTVDSSGNFTGAGWIGIAPGCPDFNIDIINGSMSGTSITFDLTASFCSGTGTESGTGIGVLNAAFPDATSASGTVTGTISDPLGTRPFEFSWTAIRQ